MNLKTLVRTLVKVFAKTIARNDSLQRFVQRFICLAIVCNLEAFASASALRGLPGAVDSISNLCVQTFNTYGPFYAPIRGTRTELLAGYLKENPCDVLFFQEVWVDEHQEKLSASLRDLGYKVFHFDHISLAGKMYGLLTAVKGEIEGQGFVEFTDNYKGLVDWVRKKLMVGKGVGVLKVKLKKLKKSVMLVNTHLHHANNKIRIKQVEQLLEVVSVTNTEKLKVIIGGDFNFDINSSEAALMKKAYFTTTKVNSDCTYCSENDFSWSFSDKRIDHIFMDQEFIEKVLSEQIEPRKFSNTFLSDHFGVRVYLK